MLTNIDASKHRSWPSCELAGCSSAVLTILLFEWCSFQNFRCAGDGPFCFHLPLRLLAHHDGHIVMCGINTRSTCHVADVSTSTMSVMTFKHVFVLLLVRGAWRGSSDSSDVVGGARIVFVLCCAFRMKLMMFGIGDGMETLATQDVVTAFCCSHFRLLKNLRIVLTYANAAEFNASIDTAMEKGCHRYQRASCRLQHGKLLPLRSSIHLRWEGNSTRLTK